MKGKAQCEKVMKIDSSNLEGNSSWRKLLPEKTGVSEKELICRLKPCSDYRLKCAEILKAIETDQNTLDFKISLYVAACNSVQLKPFPQHMVEQSVEGLQSLLLINSLIPPIILIKKSLSLKDKCRLNEHIVNVIHWLLTLHEPKFVPLKDEDSPKLFAKLNFTVNFTKPHHIFKVMVCQTSVNHLQWMTLKGDRKTEFALYSGRIEQLHSLMHMGIYHFDIKNGPYGQGVYLTNDLRDCLEHSPPNWAWGKSIYGNELQTAVVVEFIADHPEVKAYTIAEEGNTPHPQGQTTIHHFVMDPRLVQIRYILLFSKMHSKHGIQTSINNLKKTKQARLRAKYIQWAIAATGCIAIGYFIMRSIKESNEDFFSSLLERLQDTSMTPSNVPDGVPAPTYL